MKILIISDPNSPHTIKWVTSLAKKGIDIVLFGLGELKVKDYEGFKNLNVVTFKEKISRVEGSFKKVKYLKALKMLKNLIKTFNPDILHAHYATSYGLLGALTGFHPYFISVWGSDIFSFPTKSIIHKKILEFNLNKADKIFSTSNIMAQETKKYTKKEIYVVPFGVDLEMFKPIKVHSLFDKNDIVIGTVKTLEEKYGIEYLIRAFKILTDKYTTLPLKLLIVGGGSLENYLKKLSIDLGIYDQTIFTGKVPYIDTPKYHNMISVFVSVSDSESFGVAVVEAMACEKPVVVSNIGGLKEIVEDGSTGLIVPPRNPQKTAEAIERIILDKNLMINMGKAGRKKVEKLYDWNKNLEQMIEYYEKTLREFSK